MLRRAFTSHPASVGETYFQHLTMATSFGIAMLTGAVACLVHALLPFLFEKTGSQIIDGLHDRMVTNRARQSIAQSGTAEPPLALDAADRDDRCSIWIA